MGSINVKERGLAARGAAGREHLRAQDAVAAAQATVARTVALRRRMAGLEPAAAAGPRAPTGEAVPDVDALAVEALTRARRAVDQMMGLLREAAAASHAPGAEGEDDGAPTRLIAAPDGGSIRVTLAPREGGRGVPTGHALVFEHETGGWVGSIPLCTTRTLAEATEAELVELTAWVRERGPVRER